MAIFHGFFLRPKNWFEKYFMSFSSYGKYFNIFFYVFSYDLRSCEEDRDDKDEP
jgi:hypothetical protein